MRTRTKNLVDTQCISARLSSSFVVCVLDAVIFMSFKKKKKSLKKLYVFRDCCRKERNFNRKQEATKNNETINKKKEGTS